VALDVIGPVAFGYDLLYRPLARHHAIPIIPIASVVHCRVYRS
jgi:hypothetical protein